MCFDNWGTIYNTSINGARSSCYVSNNFTGCYPAFYGAAGFSPSCFGFGFCSPMNFSCNNYGFSPKAALGAGLGFGLGMALPNMIGGIVNLFKKN